MACVVEFCRPISDQDIKYAINFYCCVLSLLIFQLKLATIVAKVIPKAKFSVIVVFGELAHNRSFYKACPYKLKLITSYMKMSLGT